jgi:CheY-like chemotaxis protein
VGWGLPSEIFKSEVRARENFPMPAYGTAPPILDFQRLDGNIRVSIINCTDSTITQTGDERNPKFHHTKLPNGSAEMTSSIARVLVANNEPQIRKLFVRKLKSAGYVVSEACTGRKTLEVLQSARFDVLVLDLDIPGGDSLDVLKVVRSDMPHLRVLVISSKHQLLEAAGWFGAVAAIDKVVAPDRLVMTVKLLVGDSPCARPCESRSDA